MWLEIIITLLLGGLFYILVAQRNSKPTKRFRVTNSKRDRTVLLKYTSFESFSEKCRDQFNISKKEKLCFASDEDENLELDEECLVHLEDKSLLIAKGETARHNDDDHDENDDSLGFESHGSDNFTGDTIVDHGTMKKSEDIQAGRAKYDLGKNEKLYSASGEDENIELDEKCLVEDKALLIVKGTTSGPNDVDDKNDDKLGFKIPGSDSLTGDTVVDNADIQKWEDIQSVEIKEKEKLCFASDEDKNLELDEECLVHLEDKSLLIAKGETARHNDDDHDENDDSLGFESHGSDSFTGDTIVDHGTMKKSEDIQAGRAKYDLGKNEKLYSAFGEDENIELDEKCLVEDKSLLIVKGMTSGPNDVDDKNNDKLGFEILGSDSLTGDTVVDNADIQKWEDIQSGSDSLTGNTVVDNADIQKWKDVQSGSEVKEHIIKYGLGNIIGVLKENMDAWKSKPLNIAVTGESGKGKSSFINAFREMSPEEDGAAKVGEEECTTECQPFYHPKYDSFVLWDVPGVGTRTFPKEKYLDAIQVDRYDFFIIISCSRFSELESWLAKEILRRKKRFYFIRTKVDTDMSEMKVRFRKMGKQFLEKEEFVKLKSKISEKLYCDVQIEKLQFFMISNHHPDKYDFPLILYQLLQDVPAEKKDAMVFGIAGMSKDILVEKASALKSRIWKVALLSGAGAAIPFISMGIDTALILEEVLFYREQFGLDDQSLKHLADMAGISLEHLKSSVKLRTPVGLFTSEGLTKLFMKNVAGEVVETVVKYTIPVIGVVISCGLSFSTTMSILESLLEIMKQDALNVLMYVTTGKAETEID